MIIVVDVLVLLNVIVECLFKMFKILTSKLHTSGSIVRPLYTMYI
jgi:hypothetical protein